MSESNQNFRPINMNNTNTINQQNDRSFGPNHNQPSLYTKARYYIGYLWAYPKYYLDYIDDILVEGYQSLLITSENALENIFESHPFILNALRPQKILFVMFLMTNLFMIIQNIPYSDIKNLFYLINFVVISLVVKMYLADPGTIRKDTQLEEYISSKLPKIEKCIPCDMIRILRSFHCDICNKCTTKFEIHSFWFNKDIGSGNSFIYSLLLISLTLNLLTTSILCYKSVITSDEGFSGKDFLGLIWFIISSYLALKCIGLAKTFIRGINENLTQFERKNYWKFPYLWASFNRFLLNPFDKNSIYGNWLDAWESYKNNPPNNKVSETDDIIDILDVVTDDSNSNNAVTNVILNKTLTSSDSTSVPSSNDILRDNDDDRRNEIYQELNANDDKLEEDICLDIDIEVNKDTPKLNDVFNTSAKKEEILIEQDDLTKNINSFTSNVKKEENKESIIFENQQRSTENPFINQAIENHKNFINNQSFNSIGNNSSFNNKTTNFSTLQEPIHKCHSNFRRVDGGVEEMQVEKLEDIFINSSEGNYYQQYSEEIRLNSRKGVNWTRLRLFTVMDVLNSPIRQQIVANLPKINNMIQMSNNAVNEIKSHNHNQNCKH